MPTPHSASNHTTFLSTSPRTRNKSCRNLLWILLLSSLALAILYSVPSAPHHPPNHSIATTTGNSMTPLDNPPTRTASPVYAVAHLGNSIQYYNDCPRLLEAMLLSTVSGTPLPDLATVPDRKATVLQDSCLRGGATLPSLWERGNGMAEKFAVRPASLLPGDEGAYDVGAPAVEGLLQQRGWDFVVINDHTQSPVRPERREASKAALREHYLPALAQGLERAAAAAVSEEGSAAPSKPTTSTIVFVQTAAYKSPVKNSADLGSFDEFTEALRAGYDEYVELVQAFHRQRLADGSGLALTATVAPLGRAYQVLREEHPGLWETALYAPDDFHPSPHGTWLEACLLHCALTGEKFRHAAGKDPASWWTRARRMQPPGEAAQRLPTLDEANLLNEVAYRVYRERREHEESMTKH